MDVFIAKENIKNFKSLLPTENDTSQRHLLMELRGLEKEKLAAAIAAQAKLIAAAEGLTNTPSRDAV
ncbi:hypothetical protein [Rhizobium leucaenae]|jgi:hypothetical protein|uniref:Uncharacterized protein n=1 Tax=Rhizobium leucaenae TaxID=29450 RepID=A0A7W6ZQH8_9HYPH|nr:hypothetical protein [Rhizobium leucaenae]MBB4566734.1 hypothetical protein [Rhizobium leucaenae]MBB6301372.1 hypothetical protein [Rhizobium leucaenae]